MTRYDGHMHRGMPSGTRPPSLGRRWTGAALVAAGATVPLALAATLAPARDHIAPPTVALVLVLVVVTIAAASGRYSVAVAAALSAAVGFDYFHTRPYGSLSITRSEDVQTAVLLLVTAVLIGELAAWGRRHRETAAELTDGFEAVARASGLVVDGQPPEVIVAAASRELIALLHLRDCWFDTGRPADPMPVLERDGRVVYGDVQWPVERSGLPGPQLSLPVCRGAVTLGRFVLTPTPGEPVVRRALRCAVVLATVATSSLGAS